MINYISVLLYLHVIKNIRSRLNTSMSLVPDLIYFTLIEWIYVGTFSIYFFNINFKSVIRSHRMVNYDAVEEVIILKWEVHSIVQSFVVGFMIYFLLEIRSFIIKFQLRALFDDSRCKLHRWLTSFRYTFCLKYFEKSSFKHRLPKYS